MNPMTPREALRYALFQCFQFIRIRAFKATARHFVENDLTKNGERWLVNQVFKTHRDRSGDTFHVMDVGGNRGHWARSVVGLDPNLCVHSFEPVPKFFEELKANKVPGQDLHHVALSDKQGNETIYVTGFDAGGAAARQRPGKENYEINVPKMTGDAFLADHSDWVPHFIKIDVDGREIAVLNGLRKTIASHQPAIQFEFGDFSYYCDAPFHRFWTFAEELGYELYRLHPGKLQHIRKYRAYHELPINLNYVMLPKGMQLR